MFAKKTISLIWVISLIIASTACCQNLEDNWNELLHYVKIGRLDLAKGYAQVIIQSNPEPVELLGLSEKNPAGYAILLRVSESEADAELTQLAAEVLNIIEQGKFIRRADPKIIVEEVKRLSSGTSRGRLLAVKRLRNAGEYAIMYMLDAMAEEPSDQELANLIWALPQIGREAIRPLVAALQTDDIEIKTEIIKALGEIAYPQSLAYLKYLVENDGSPELRIQAATSIGEIDPAALDISAAQLFYRLAENYYYHIESLLPAEDADFANIWFWDSQKQRLYRKPVDKSYFHELMAMRACEWALKTDPEFGLAIGLWQAAFFKAESTGLKMPDYFGQNHASAGVYATTVGPEYLHQALARALRDKNAYVALGAVEALATTAGEKSLLYRLGTVQPLVEALSFNGRAVRYSAAIAIGSAGPKESFAQSSLVTTNLAEAITQSLENVTEDTAAWNGKLADAYAIRCAQVMLKLAETKNKVIDLLPAKDALINATKDNRQQIQSLAGRILARLDSPDAQRAIAQMAIDENNALDVRIAGFDSLAISAKLNANLLDNQAIQAVYALVASQQIDPHLRSAAAVAFGALNLPSEKVKSLILDQAKS